MGRGLYGRVRVRKWIRTRFTMWALVHGTHLMGQRAMSLIAFSSDITSIAHGIARLSYLLSTLAAPSPASLVLRSAVCDCVTVELTCSSIHSLTLYPPPPIGHSYCSPRSRAVTARHATPRPSRHAADLTSHHSVAPQLSRVSSNSSRHADPQLAHRRAACLHGQLREQPRPQLAEAQPPPQ